MQLALTAYALVLMGAGVVVLLAVLFVVLRRARRHRPDTPDPTASDWTGEAATGDPVSRPAMDAAETTTSPPDGPRTGTPRAAPDAPTPDDAAPEAPAPDDAALDASGAEVGVPAEARAARPAGDRTGAGRGVASAVAQALAVRAAAERASRTTTPSSDGDVRDRLLAVLLDDPAGAVGATVELEACRAQLDRLSDAIRHQRAALGEVLGRLSEAGLRPEQLSRLSGLPIDEVHELRARANTPV